MTTGKLLLDDVKYVLNSLNISNKPRAFKIFKKRFIEGNTLEEIAIMFKISRERVRQIEAKIVRNVKRYFKEADVFN